MSAVPVPGAPDPTAQLQGWSPAAPLPAANSYSWDILPKGPLPQHPRLTKQQIAHLALEGGGGKGFAYLGAIRALEELGILQHRTNQHGQKRLEGQVRGFAGASAGAITSMLLSCGLDSHDIDHWMTTEVDFSKFFDPASPRQDFQGRPIVETPEEQRTRESDAWKIKTVRVPLFVVADKPKVIGDAAALENPPPGKAAAKSPPWGPADGALTKGATIAFEILEGIGPLPVTVMAKDLDARLAWLDRDMGIFSGAFAWSAFDQLLRSRFSNRSSSAGPVTFTEHHYEFGVTLSLTGSNLYTGKTVYFNAFTTPDLPVATAVRASMSLPMIFKPVLIESDDPEIDGLYVDGGVWNNTPVDAFDDDRSQPTTLVLRLDIDAVRSFDGFGAFVGRYLGLTAGGSGESQYTQRRAFQAIELDTTGLDTVDFTPPKAARDAAAKRAYARTLDYFRGG